MSDIWFKPKTYGYGATPANWKGWVATFVFIAATLVLSMALLASVATPKGDTPVAVVALLGALQLALVFGFIILSRIKTDGAWRWRWGR